MEVTQSRKHLIYALGSFASPILAILITLTYQSIAHAEDWRLYGDDIAGAYLGLAELIQLLFALAIGSAMGLVFAAISLWLRHRFLTWGSAALAFNVLPFAFAAYFIVKGVTRGL